MMYIIKLLLLFLVTPLVAAKIHTFHFTTSWKSVQIPGIPQNKSVITLNGQWPPPAIHVNKGDTVELYLTNGFDDLTQTSLHFHGLLQTHSNIMDGPSMITQCPIGPGSTFFYNFTVNEQTGTYWYHAHNGAQYGDGLRGPFIVHDPSEPFTYDEERVVTLSDLYLQKYTKIQDEFLSRYNPTGAEPIPQYSLINDRLNDTIHFEVGKTYLLRFINMGLFVSQYIQLEDHEMTIVEVDGVYTKPNVTNTLYVATGQRVSVIVKAKEVNPHKNFAMVQVMDETMLDVVPDDLALLTINQISYNDNYKYPQNPNLDVEQMKRNSTNDFYLTTHKATPLLDHYDRQIVLDVRMQNLGDGIKYAFFNNVSYTAAKLPVLTTVLTSGKLANDIRIYGDNLNAFIFEPNEVIEVVLNNYDTGRHPFHLHGHNFQVVQKSPAFHEDETFPDEDQDKMTVPYNESAPLMKMPNLPILRDTVILEPNGHVVLRFRASNPGVWLFHCHLDWHLQQGLVAVFIEDPFALQEHEELTDNYKDVCANVGIANRGNAAGHDDDWFNLDGLPRQPEPLPYGFTTKGYIAMFISVVVALMGLWTIADYGLTEILQDDEAIFLKLKAMIDQSNNESH
ncbi:hypothetical protein KAFR_0C03610 [Kazachstania africana CBS 2517]|uniref:Iron transport multicopper oxidase FET5 n=1 Tax=Kazachstania africana (strain ATCC 22294 / BCRC 22015 / CBS 2517 / CECT 1963 / NBRC 1671 / NRRL Y-8276) TaxID=1071382 RepID=H2ASK3_KAZAF|nr:hypothetical protein KAFR_0C03610 [Kazachstania africana CBS 2517]CCF57353.1 hypothetical protein KAFR_0C03610 [Kazachstania africana CBS 2517]